MPLRSLFSALVGAVVLSLVVGNTFWPHRHETAPTRYSRFEVELTANTSGIAQVYFDNGHNYNEGDSVTRPVIAGAPSVLSFPLPTASLRALRFDPLNTAGTIALRQARLVDPDGQVLRAFAPEAFAAANQIAKLTIAGDRVVIEVAPGSNDPFLFVDLGAESLALRVDQPGWLLPLFQRALQPFVVISAVFVFGLLAWRRWPGQLRGAGATITVWTVAHPKSAIAVTALFATLLSSYPVVFCGASYVSPNYGTALLYDAYPTLPGSRAAEVVDPRGADVGAIMWSHVPLSMVQTRSLARDFELPLWNRYNSAGTPLIGQGQSMFGEPLQVLVWIGGGRAWAWDLKYLAAKWLMGLALGLTVLRATRHFGAALITGGASIFVGFFVFRVNHPAFFSFCAAPWVLYGWCLIVTAAERRGAVFGSLALLAGNWALLTSGTAKEAYVSILVLNFAGTVTVLVCQESWRTRLERLGGAVAAGILLLLLAAPIWLTFLDSMRASYSSYNAAYAFQLEPSLALGFFDEVLLRPFWEGEAVYNPSSNFLLLAGLLFFLANVRELARNRFALGIGLAALVPAAFAFGVVPPRWIALWPIIGNVHHIDNSFGIGFIHLTTILAGFGFASAARRLGTPEGRGDLAIAGLLLLALAAHYLGITQTVQRSTRTFLLWGQTIPRSDFVWASFAGLLGAAIAVPWAIHRARTRRHLGIGTAFVIVTGVVVLLWRHGMHATSPHPTHMLNAAPRADFFARSPALEWLRHDMAEPARVHGFAGNLFPGWNDTYALEGINGPDALMNRHVRELQAAFGIERIWDWRLLVYPDTFAPVRPFFDLMNVRYLLDYRGDQGRLRSLLTPGLMSDLEVYRNDTAWPRAFFTDRLALYRTPSDFAALVRQEGRPLAAVQIGDESAPSRADSTLEFSSRRVVPARAYRLTNNSTRFIVDAPNPGVVVLSEAWLKDCFRVQVNGHSDTCFRVNHAFKGVRIDRAGTYEIEFTYRPPYWSLSLVAAFIGLAGLGTGILWLWRTRGVPIDVRTDDRLL